jgi:hypothetical protein
MAKTNLKEFAKIQKMLTDSLRKNLFSETPDEKRAFFGGLPLEVSNWQTVIYNGEELNQDDLKVWDALVKMARKNEKELTCQFNVANFLKRLKRPTNEKERLKLHVSIVRLTATAVQVIRQNQIMIFPLVENIGAISSEENIKFSSRPVYVIKLNAGMIGLLGKPSP